jgi:hypothetical protein
MMAVNPCVLTLEKALRQHRIQYSPICFFCSSKNISGFPYAQPFSTTRFLELGTGAKIKHIGIKNGKSLELILSQLIFVLMEPLQDPSMPDAANDAAQAAAQQAIITHDNFIHYHTFQNSNDDRRRRQTGERISIEGQILTWVATFAIMILMAVIWLQEVGNLSRGPGGGR